MNKEVPLQADLFSGELVDNRTRRQKKLDKQRTQPHQGELFSQREMAQFGVQANPLIPLSPHTRLRLIAEDPRTEEEKERDRQREIEESNYRLLYDAVLAELQSKPPAGQNQELDDNT